MSYNIIKLVIFAKIAKASKNSIFKFLPEQINISAKVVGFIPY